ncbi:hypothetical protein B296_00039355 [Ensete ventricosum]|uniref:Uncharacterized protein n=1 Tax=Ensete ventricosum TaxID=4639 RepID=A0A426YX71_ENSVE|nr:hypothetical protein B296_00039355 [Ensete ventricosum]
MVKSGVSLHWSHTNGRDKPTKPPSPPTTLRLPNPLLGPRSLSFTFLVSPDLGSSSGNMRWYQVPAFGHWNLNFYDEISISQYFESAREAGLVRPRLFGGDGEDLFRVLSPYKKDQQTAKGKKKGGERRGGEKMMPCGKQELRKPKAVDEDLYKIPPEMFDQMPKKASPKLLATVRSF